MVTVGFVHIVPIMTKQHVTVAHSRQFEISATELMIPSQNAMSQLPMH